MSGIDSFFNILAAYKKTLSWALGSSAILPLLASFAGLSPFWPPGVPLLTSLFTLISVIICFQVLNRESKRVVTKIMIWSIIAFLFFLIAYLVIFSVFTTKLPTTGEMIYLGCGWSDFSKEIASDFMIDIDQDCPGQFDRILRSAEYESSVVWTKSSLTIIRILALGFWLISFSFFAIFVGSFLVYQSRQKA